MTATKEAMLESERPPSSRSHVAESQPADDEKPSRRLSINSHRGTSPGSTAAHGRSSPGNQGEKEPATADAGKQASPPATEADCGVELGPSTLAGAETAVERWNMPKGNIVRLAFVFLAFIIAGLNDGAVGALLPYVRSLPPPCHPMAERPRAIHIHPLTHR